MKALARLGKALRAILERVGPRLALGLVGALTAALLFAALAYRVVRGETQAFDEATRQAVRGLASPGWTAFFRAVTELGSPRTLVPLSLAAVTVFLFERRRRAALLLAITMLGVIALDNGLKLGFARARPMPFFGLSAPASYSFPSGHALASFCFFGSLAALLGARIRRRAIRVAVWTAATLVILAVGFSRIYLGVHYASDVLGGYSAGVIWVVTVASADRAFRRGDRPGAPAPAAEPVARS